MKPEELRKYYIKTYEELFQTIDRRLRTTSAPKIKTRKTILLLKNTLLAKLGTAYNVLTSELEKIVEALEKIDNMHSFYRDLFKLETGKEPRELTRVFRRMIRNASIIYREHRGLIKSAEETREVVKNFRAGIGRLLSIYRRKKKVIESIKKALIELSKLPDISGEYIVIIAGMPQVGKSTLLSKLTRAKPEISPFPFTTKTVIVGHISVEPYGKITVIDTPGILDRPIDEKNPIEIKAVLAIKHLADTVLYLFDVNPQSYYSFEEQLNVYESIVNVMGSDKVIPIINKIDITPKNVLEEKTKVIMEKYGKKPLLISALKEENIEYIRSVLIEKFMEKNQFPQQ